jgi:uncharacterized protein YegL
MNTITTIVNPGELEHADNPTARVPVMILADVSSSMSGAPIGALQSGLRLFFADIQNDARAQLSCDPTIFTFGGTVEQAMPWEAKMVGMTPVPTLKANGNTPLGEAVWTAIEAIRQRQELYRKKAIQSYKPWVVLFSDGAPTDQWESAALELSRLATMNKWTVICVATGPEANIECLARFSPIHAPLVFRDSNSVVCFRELFRWLSSSIKVSSHKPAAEPQLAALPASIAIAE